MKLTWKVYVRNAQISLENMLATKSLRMKNEKSKYILTYTHEIFQFRWKLLKEKVRREKIKIDILAVTNFSNVIVQRRIRSNVRCIIFCIQSLLYSKIRSRKSLSPRWYYLKQNQRRFLKYYHNKHNRAEKLFFARWLAFCLFFLSGVHLLLWLFILVSTPRWIQYLG